MRFKNLLSFFCFKKNALDTIYRINFSIIFFFLTIAQNLSDAEHDDIFGQLRMIGFNEQETIDRIHLLNQLEDGSWTTYETFRLSGAE